MSLSFARSELLLALALIPVALWLGHTAGRFSPRRRRWVLALRATVLALVVLGLARPSLVAPVHERGVAFLVDASDSVPAAERARAGRFVAAALDGADPDDQAAVVAFGARALLDRPARPGPLEPLRSQPGGGRTDIAAALRLGLAALPADSGRRLVLLSDGRANQGQLERPLELARAQRVPVDVVALAAESAPNEVLLARVEAPTGARVGQHYDVVAVVRARQAGPAHVRVSSEEAVLLDEDVTLAVGENRFRAPVTAGAPGFRRYRAQVAPATDTRAENNQAAAYTLVSGPPSVLVVALAPERAGPLLAALAASQREARLVAPDEMPTHLLGLADYEAVALVDVPARAVPDAAEAALEAYVRDLGKGLLMVGGEDSFGAGGWKDSPVEKALPVEMTVRDKEKRPDVALAFVIDQSGSMGEGGSPASMKLELAKEAVRQAGLLLRPEDEVALVSFDDTAYVRLPLARHERPALLSSAVTGLMVGGGTNIQAGWSAGLEELAKSDAPVRHVILLTDGWSDAGGYEQLLARMERERMTLSTLAIGADAAAYLGDLARQGGGRHYAVRQPADVPAVFVEETQTALGTYLVEERFQPVPGADSAILSGLDAARLPALNGYDGTTAKQTARVALWSHQEDPLLAQWQYGLGRAVAWTSDLKGQWAADWLGSPDFGPFVTQLVDWTLPEPDDQGLALDVSVDGGTATVRLDARDAAGAALDFLDLAGRFSGPDGQSVPVTLRQTAAGSYEGAAELPAQGAWLLRLEARRDGDLAGARTAGVVVPYSPEYADPADAPGAAHLLQLAEATGGRVLTSPGAAFAPVAGVTRGQEAWPWLLLAAALLFPLDVAARRLRLGRADLAIAAAWLRRPAHPAAAPAREKALGGLFAARERARHRATPGPGPDLPPSTAPAHSTTPAPPTISPPRSPAPPTTPPIAERPVPPGSDAPDRPGPDRASPGDTLGRLRDAKRRARRG